MTGHDYFAAALLILVLTGVLFGMHYLHSTTDALDRCLEETVHTIEQNGDATVPFARFLELYETHEHLFSVFWDDMYLHELRRVIMRAQHVLETEDRDLLISELADLQERIRNLFEAYRPTVPNIF